jgi:hypothetical protein
MSEVSEEAKLKQKMIDECKPDMNLHRELLRIGHDIERGTTHTLEDVMIDGIIATFDVMGASSAHIQMMIFDLKKAKYKIFDWLGMMYTGRYQSGDTSDKMVFKIVQKMVEHYVVMKDVGGWAWSYRGHIDLEAEFDMNKSYSNGIHCQDCIDSYMNWQEDMKREIK